jgi:hypothetical protein
MFPILKNTVIFQIMHEVNVPVTIEPGWWKEGTCPRGGLCSAGEISCEVDNVVCPLGSARWMTYRTNKTKQNKLLLSFVCLS